METKISLNIILPGRVLLSEEESKNKKIYKHTNLAVEENGKKETLHIAMRQCKNTQKTLNISDVAYNHWVSAEGVMEGYSKEFWATLKPERKVELHIQELVKELGGIDYSYKIF